MSFIRVKRRMLKGHEVRYAYLVKNSWDRKSSSPRQKVSKYLGRVFTPEKNELDFVSYIEEEPQDYLSRHGRNRILKDLVLWELKRHDADVQYSADRRTILKRNKEIVLQINEGYLCGYTIRRLFNFNAKEEDERETGLRLAEMMTEAGIQVPREIFVGLFDKVAGTEY